MRIAFGKSYYLRENEVTTLCNDVIMFGDDGEIAQREAFRISSQWKDADNKPQKKDYPLKLRQDALDKILKDAGLTEKYKGVKYSKENIEYFDFLNGSIDKLGL